ncbi:MAG: DNA polymerase III subunit gamma/tau [Acidobacteriota bacterium]|nr:DNA polymerase III subunit gamma/tau [Acidobacteriota bacterium]
MAYQVLARKWRPQRFDDVIGQRGVTQTLRNAIAQDRLAQAFVFAGPRGVGKTTTARILARALNCVEGPTADPCGKCDACREVAEGRDIDVLEIDAATHTQVDNVREVIIAGLSITPVRDRFKVFIIDEVHQLSSSSFNALLKSVEEPPAHVVFIMATTLLDKIPDTILSRSQVFEFRTIGTAAIIEQLTAITKAEDVSIDDAGLALVARTADGSMRDAQSALDQVIAFAGTSVTSEEVSTVLGLIGRDTVLDMAETVADEAAARVFELSSRFVEAGYDLRSVCRELSRLVRDLLVLKVDPQRISDPEIAAEAEHDRLRTLTERFSREDLLRGFDVLSRAEFEIRSATQPRYHFEMAMIRWMHLRSLVPLAELFDGLERQPSPMAPASRTKKPPVSSPAKPVATARADSLRRPPASAPTTSTSPAPTRPRASAPSVSPATDSPPVPSSDLKDAFLAELKRTKKFFHGTVAAQAQQIVVEDNRVTFVFSETQRTLAQQVESGRSWLEGLATQVGGTKILVGTRQVTGVAPVKSKSAEPPVETPTDVRQPSLTAPPTNEPPLPDQPPGDMDVGSRAPEGRARPTRQAPTTEDGPPDDLLADAMDDPAVQTMLEVFSAEIKDVEEI